MGDFSPDFISRCAAGNLAFIMEFCPKLYFLTGCTAVGKTEISLYLARKLNAEILSCDSVQVYRGADIGSAKISLAERQEIPHYGIDLCSPDHCFSVDQYQSYVRKLIPEMAQRKRNLLIVGGTGFYLKSFFSSVTDAIAVPQEVRNEVENLYRCEGIDALQRAIQSYGETDINESDWSNAYRLCHILEKQKVTNLPQVELKRQFLSNEVPYANFFKTVICLQRSRDSLVRRAEIRLNAMFVDGFLKEAENLWNRYGASIARPLRQAVGYKTLFDFFQYGGDLKDAKQLILIATRHLIKKQETWLKKQIPIDHFIDLDRNSSNESFDFIDSVFRGNRI